MGQFGCCRSGCWDLRLEVFEVESFCTQGLSLNLKVSLNPEEPTRFRVPYYDFLLL